VRNVRTLSGDWGAAGLLSRAQCIHTGGGGDLPALARREDIVQVAFLALHIHKPANIGDTLGQLLRQDSPCHILSPDHHHSREQRHAAQADHRAQERALSASREVRLPPKEERPALRARHGGSSLQVGI